MSQLEEGAIDSSELEERGTAHKPDSPLIQGHPVINQHLKELEALDPKASAASARLRRQVEERMSQDK